MVNSNVTAIEFEKQNYHNKFSCRHRGLVSVTLPVLSLRVISTYFVFIIPSCFCTSARICNSTSSCFPYFKTALSYHPINTMLQLVLSWDHLKKIKFRFTRLYLVSSVAPSTYPWLRVRHRRPCPEPSSRQTARRRDPRPPRRFCVLVPCSAPRFTETRQRPRSRPSAVSPWCSRAGRFGFLRPPALCECRRKGLARLGRRSFCGARAGRQRRCRMRTSVPGFLSSRCFGDRRGRLAMVRPHEQVTLRLFKPTRCLLWFCRASLSRVCVVPCCGPFPSSPSRASLTWPLLLQTSFGDSWEFL